MVESRETMVVAVEEEGWAFAFAARSRSEAPVLEGAQRSSVGVGSH